ncbi:BspA family leucine-rich repeat surface protein [Aquimarina megaterium]|uniref:BspA family leucine-rich repeat surface protein n=1 Tax=Aquimarina megaterium TaxID=1443666 RepID=UPI0009446C58|nr:BspA family leucine-rich repeat surface protein [Aquimarina megaterium]
MKNLAKFIVLLFVLTALLNCSNDDDPKIAQNNIPVINNQSFTVVENIADNIPIGLIEASDPDGDTLVFSVSVNDDNLFEISDEGILSLDDLKVLDYEASQSHTITVVVTDGKTAAEAIVTINLTDVDDTSFVTTWRTTGSNEMVIIPTRSTEFTYDYTIDWGDGTTQTGRTADATHTYTNAGIHTVSISGTFPAIDFSNITASQAQIRTVEQWGIIQWLTMQSAFAGVNTLIISAIDAPDLSQATDMSSMFFAVNTLLNGNFNTWDTSNVTNMGSMFENSSFNQDISSWDVKNVTDMRSMFSGTPFNQNIDTWDVSNVVNMFSMFRNSSFNRDISSWNVSNATDMGSMFRDTPFNQDIRSWNVSNVTNMFSMFNSTSFNQDIGSWNVGNVTDMGFMFLDTPFNQDIRSWNVSNVIFCDNFASNSPLTAVNTPNFMNCTP